MLRRLAEPGTRAGDRPRNGKGGGAATLPDGTTLRTGVVDRAVAQAFALKDWIAVPQAGRVTTYEITTAGRAALKRFLAEDEAGRAGRGAQPPWPTSTATGETAR